MRNCINIKGNDQVFPYIIDYSKGSGNILVSDYKYTIDSINNVIRFLREREVVHYQRFVEALRLATDRLNQKNVYAINPTFDK